MVVVVVVVVVASIIIITAWEKIQISNMCSLGLQYITVAVLLLVAIFAFSSKMLPCFALSCFLHF